MSIAFSTPKKKVDWETQIIKKNKNVIDIFAEKSFLPLQVLWIGTIPIVFGAKSWPRHWNEVVPT